MTAAMTQTVCHALSSLAAGRQSVFALERRHQQPLDLRDLAVEPVHGAVGADVDDMHVDHPADLVDLQHDGARNQVDDVDRQRQHQIRLDRQVRPQHRAAAAAARA